MMHSDSSESFPNCLTDRHRRHRARTCGDSRSPHFDDRFSPVRSARHRRSPLWQILGRRIRPSLGGRPPPRPLWKILVDYFGGRRFPGFLADLGGFRKISCKWSILGPVLMFAELFSVSRWCRHISRRFNGERTSSWLLSTISLLISSNSRSYLPLSWSFVLGGFRLLRAVLGGRSFLSAKIDLVVGEDRRSED